MPVDLSSLSVAVLVGVLLGFATLILIMFVVLVSICFGCSKEPSH